MRFSSAPFPCRGASLPPPRAFSWKPSPTTPVHSKEHSLLWLGGSLTPALVCLTLPASALFAALGWGRRRDVTRRPAQGECLAHRELTILQMDLASSENFWEYTSSVSRTRRSTSSRFTFSLRPRNGDWPSIIS